MKVLLFWLMFIFSSVYVEAAESELHIGKFSNGDLTGWKEQTTGIMKPKTVYSLSKDKDNDRTILIAHSTKSASGKIYKLNLDPQKYPVIKWSWKIDHIIKKGNEKLKEGDDFAVRVYVVFPRGFFSKTRAICYVWANKLPKGAHVVSPFTTNIITVAEDSGDELAGRWTFHNRNVYEDYKNFFGEEPPKVGAIALMTDSDNTGELAVGYYGDIFLLRSTDNVTPLPSSKPDELKHNEQKSSRVMTQKEQKQKDQGNKEQPGKVMPALPPSTAPSSP